MPIPPSEIVAWATLRRVSMLSWELDAILALDAVFLASIAEK